MSITGQTYQHERMERDRADSYSPGESSVSVWQDDVRRPFLDATSTDTAEDDDDGFGLEGRSSKRETPAPIAQLLILCAVRMVDPLSFTQIFPYVNQMIIDLRVTDNPSHVGFYSGLVDSALSVSQLFTIYHWAKFSDRVGRRPVIFTSTIGVGLCTAWFGLSKSLWSMLAARCISGLLTGNAAVVFSALAELTDETNQALVYPVFGLVWPIGSIVGPLIGGSLSHPDVNIPTYFDTPFFREHPYFLPCIVATLYSLIAASVGLCFLEETHPLKRDSNRGAASSIELKRATVNTPVFKHESDYFAKQNLPATLTVWNMLKDGLISTLCWSGFALSFLAVAFDVVFVLFSYSPITSGGLARSPMLIGYSLAIAGLSSGALQIFLMPRLLRTYDLAIMYKYAVGLFIPAFACLPCLNLLARKGVDASGALTSPTVKALLWLGIAITMLLGRAATLAFSLNMILVKRASPTPEALSTTNAVTQFFQALGRSVSPAVVSTLFALSIDHNILGGYMWVAVMCVVGFVGYWAASRISRIEKGYSFLQPSV